MERVFISKRFLVLLIGICIILSALFALGAQPPTAQAEGGSKTTTKTKTKTTTTAEPEQELKATCNRLNASRISNNEFQFTASSTVGGGGEVTGYRFTYGDGSIETSSSGVINHTYSKAGVYTVKAEVRVKDADNHTSYVAGADCSETVNASAPATEDAKQVKVCNPATGEITSVDQGNEDEFESANAAACKEIKVCDLTKKETVTITNGEYDSVEYSKDLSRCEATTTVSDDDDSAVVSTTTSHTSRPKEIASTGPESFVIGGLGLGSLTAAGYYFLGSRRALLNKLQNRS